jgi:Xaa-Pro aminopeptidase
MEAFRRAQRLAYDAAIDVARALTPGVTERDAAARLEAALVARGVRRWFHAPFAWFGDRTRFAGINAPTKFFPGDRRLEAGMVGILDVAPVVDTVSVDIGYTFREGGPDAELTRAMDTLRAVRALIPPRIAAGDTMRAIYAKVDDVFAAAGFDNRHARYPFGVLGHRVGHAERRLPGTRVGGFGLDALASLLGGELASRVPGLRRASPLWTADSARPPAPGLWSMEPHLGAHRWGAKFEEILVVEPGGRAWWLDDSLPHVRS